MTRESPAFAVSPRRGRGGVFLPLPAYRLPRGLLPTGCTWFEPIFIYVYTFIRALPSCAFVYYLPGLAWPGLAVSLPTFMNEKSRANCKTAPPRANVNLLQKTTQREGAATRYSLSLPLCRGAWKMKRKSKSCRFNRSTSFFTILLHVYCYCRLLRHSCPPFLKNFYSAICKHIKYKKYLAGSILLVTNRGNHVFSFF